MTLEELKTEWQQYNQKLALSQRLNEQLIMSILKERSRSRVSKIRRDNWMIMLTMTLELVFLAGVFAGNPFDFKYSLQYVPYVILSLGIILAIISLIKSLIHFSGAMNNVNLDMFLKKTIKEYENTEKMQSWFGFFMFTGAIFTVFSFLPKKLEHKALWPALAETGIIILITVAVYLIAFKLGAFKNRKKEGFENDLKELNELRTISSQLSDN